MAVFGAPTVHEDDAPAVPFAQPQTFALRLRL